MTERYKGTIPNDRDIFELLRDVFSRDSFIASYMEQAHVILMLKLKNRPGEKKRDIVLWCNDAALEHLGKTANEVWGYPSAKTWPDADRFHVDDMKAIESKNDLLRFMESYDKASGGPLLMTSKFNVEWDGGEPALMVICVNGTKLVEGMREKAETGHTGENYVPGSASKLVQSMRDIVEDLEELKQRYGSR